MTEKIYGRQMMSGSQPLKEVGSYKCGFCGFKFKQYVRRVALDNKIAISSQVKCPACGNLLKTW